MSKSILLKLKDDIFSETEELTKSRKIPRNKYINNAVSFYNKMEKRRLLKKQFHKEVDEIGHISMEVLDEFEQLEDEIIE